MLHQLSREFIMQPHTPHRPVNEASQSVSSEKGNQKKKEKSKQASTKGNRWWGNFKVGSHTHRYMTPNDQPFTVLAQPALSP